MDIDISSAVDWWDVWKLRLLVLASTVIQAFLFLYGSARRAPVQRWFRVCIWLAYIAGDSLAIYALATLLNRHSRVAPEGTMLEVVWAPVLLVHLAGQEQITAYSIQDNELWKRHIATLVSQVAIAVYVFYVSWSGGDRRLLVAAILMFIIGIYKFSTKPWALKRASFGNLVRSPASLARRKQLIGSTRGRCLTKFWRLCTNTLLSWVMPAGDTVDRSAWRHIAAEQEEKEATEEELDILEYVQRFQQTVAESRAGGDNATPPLLLSYTDAFAGDILVPYSRRLKILHFMFNFACKQGKSAVAVGMGLDKIYSRLYTRANAATTPIGLGLRLVTFSLSIAAITLFARTPKSHYDVVDVKVTYILFCSVALLELVSFANLLILDVPLVVPPASFSFEYMVSQQSLISSAARRWKTTILLRLATCIGCDDDVNRHWYITRTPASDMILEAVIAHVNNGLDEYIRDNPGRYTSRDASDRHLSLASLYRRFNDLRGQWALHKRLSVLQAIQASHGHDDASATRNQQRDVLLRSMRCPFDESVLLWHVATEICFHHGDADGGSPRKLARVISCYMMYLLSARPEMLMLGTRHHLFSTALDDIELIMKYSELDAVEGDGDSNDRSIARAILHTVQRRETWVYRDGVGPLIPKACELADVLLQLLRLQEKETWEMVQDVWVEMLCYSASRGRGYMHAVSHGERCELLSRIWLLLCFMGMETLADRLQRAKEEEEEKKKKESEETTSNNMHTK